MFLAMDPRSLDFFERALKHGWQTESRVALVGCVAVGLLVLPWPRARHRTETVPGPTAATPTVNGAARLFGPIRSAGGRDIGSGVAVVLLGADGLPVAKTRTSAGGRYEFPDVPAGHYTLTVLTMPPTCRPVEVQGVYPTECPIQLDSVVGSAG
jgi:hypothetical protein